MSSGTGPRYQVDTQWMLRHDVDNRISRRMTRLTAQESKLDEITEDNEEQEISRTMSIGMLHSIKEKITAVKEKLTQTGQLFQDWEDIDNEQRAKLIKDASKALEKIEGEMTIIDLEILALEVPA